MKTSFVRALLVFCLSWTFLGLAAPAALAHDSLKSSTPAKNAVVTGLDQIELEFSARVSFPAVVLTDAAGRRFESGPPTAEGPKVIEKVAGPLPSGSYVIAWRVVSSDGHPVEGEIPFTVNAPGVTAPAPAAPSASTPEATAQGATAPGATAPSSGETAPGGGFPVWIWAVLALFVVVVAAMLLRGRGSARPGPTRTDTTSEPARPQAPQDGE
ncbi:copper resistance CopC family protein [Sphaerisporangium album]|uniref:copper resistance CopC family protein n=1 Tax=Sphaerisporangium album TaxID=509200 RepID=UPI0015F0F614|nr:copper resistance CopC family protein [Sphaerisporangium album]